MVAPPWLLASPTDMARKKKAPPSQTDALTQLVQAPLLNDSPAQEWLDIGALETWLWSAACVIRGATDAPKFKDFILPLIFFKRLSDVFDDELARLTEQWGSEEVARDIVRLDNEAKLKDQKHTSVVRFYVPADYRWERLRNHGTEGLGQFVTTAMNEVARRNPRLQGVLDLKDYNEKQSGRRSLDDDRLAALIEVISRHRLGLSNTEPDILGRAYEYLLRKFAEGQGQSAGEFYTPKEVGWLMAKLLDPIPRTLAYDPTCGSAGLLLKLRLHYEQTHPDQRALAPRLHGQELNPTTYAMAKMNAILHDYTEAYFAIGDTILNPGFGGRGAGVQRFDYVVANPMWNQSNYNDGTYDADKWARFPYGKPPGSTADWGWVQHILASMTDAGRAAVVLDTGAVSRGSGSPKKHRERDIRGVVVEEDLVEGVILLPDNLFYNTGAPGIILLLNRAKSADHREQMLLINASSYFEKGKPKNFLTEDGITAIVEVFHAWETRDRLSRVVSLEEVRKADYNLSPSQFVHVGEQVSHRPLSEIVNDLHNAAAKRERSDRALTDVLSRLGLDEGEV